MRRPGDGSVALQAVGHRIELVPLNNPGALGPGDTLRLSVRFDGKAMAGLTLNAGHAGQPDSTHAFTATVDREGLVRVPITRPGLWYARVIHMREAREAPFNWESFWASLTFTVP